MIWLIVGLVAWNIALTAGVAVLFWTTEDMPDELEVMSGEVPMLSRGGPGVPRQAPNERGPQESLVGLEGNG